MLETPCSPSCTNTTSASAVDLGLRAPAPSVRFWEEAELCGSLPGRALAFVLVCGVAQQSLAEVRAALLAPASEAQRPQGEVEVEGAAV